jgi:hypothetical protein
VGNSQVKSQAKGKEEIKSPKKSLSGSGTSNAGIPNKKNETRAIDNVPTPKKVDSNGLVLSPKQSRTK